MKRIKTILAAALAIAALPAFGIENGELTIENEDINNCPLSIIHSQFVCKPLFALKTNLLFDAATAINAEVEVPIGPRWSVAVESIFPWWLWERKQYCLQALSGNLEGRYWFGERENRPRLTGWFAGVYSGAGYYDVEWGDRGIQGEFFITAGLSGGYAHRIGRKGDWRMEYSLGAGYLRTHYREYDAALGMDETWHLNRRQSGRYTWIGPTRAKVSLVWMLRHGYKSEKKGGVK